MPASMHDTAAFFRLTLALGWIEPRQVVAWAGALVEQHAQPDPALIDLSLSSNAAPSDVEALLHELSGDYRPAVATRMLLAYIQRQYHAGNFHAEDIIPTLYGLARSEMIALPYDIALCIEDLQQALDDVGHGNHDALDDIETELLACLQWGDDADRWLPDAYL